MQDRHEVILDANITGFKQKINEATNISKTASDKIKKDMSIGYKLPNITERDLTVGVIEADNKISNLNANFELLNRNMVLSRNSIGGVSEGLVDVSKSADKVSDSTLNIGNTISNNFKKGLKSVKRLTLGFLGARSAFMLFRKYLGEYQSQNEEFASKMQLTTNTIVNALAPAFEWFGNVIQYVIIGLAKVVELLFGVNILSRQ